MDQFYYNLGVTQESFRFSIVTEQEVLKILKGLNVSKSTGHDNISAKFLRDGANEIVSAISHIINLSLRTNTVPEDFKVARVVPLYKKGDRNYVGNFRPVSIYRSYQRLSKELFTIRFPNILIAMVVI